MVTGLETICSFSQQYVPQGETRMQKTMTIKSNHFTDVNQNDKMSFWVVLYGYVGFLLITQSSIARLCSAFGNIWAHEVFLIFALSGVKGQGQHEPVPGAAAAAAMIRCLRRLPQQLGQLVKGAGAGRNRQQTALLFPSTSLAEH